MLRFTGEEKLYFMRTIFMDLFMSTFLVGSLLYFIETVRPGAVSRFIPLSFFLCLTLAAALLAFLLTGEVAKKNRKRIAVFFIALFGLFLFFASGLSLLGRLSVSILFVGFSIFMVMWNFDEIGDIPRT